MFDRFRSAEEADVRAQHEALKRLLQREPSKEKVEELRALATALGASTGVVGAGREATQPELIANIHVALQTKTMLAMLRTTSNYVVATYALVSVTAAGVAVALVAALGCRC